MQARTFTRAQRMRCEPPAPTHQYDDIGRLKTIPLGNGAQSGLIRTVAYDEANRITALTHVNSTSVAQAANDHSFGYDNLDRLTSWSQNTAAQSYGYDLSGNRNTSTVGATAYALTIAATSNRLSATTGPVATTNTFDAAGNILSNGTATFTYSDRGRMSSAKVAANTVKYLYNGLDQRVQQSGPTAVLIGSLDINSSAAR